LDQRIRISPRLNAIKFTLSAENILLLSNLLEYFREKEINIWLGIAIKDQKNFLKITLCFNPQETEPVIGFLQKNLAHLDFLIIKGVNIISVFPWRDDPDMVFRFIKVLENNLIPWIALNTSLSSISGVIPENYSFITQKALEEAFNKN
jgi:aspartokinase